MIRSPPPPLISITNFSIIDCRHWLKVSISLTLVMGITWIIGLLAYSKSLIAVAYFYTVFVAGQGILLFIILIILSQQV